MNLGSVDGGRASVTALEEAGASGSPLFADACPEALVSLAGLLNSNDDDDEQRGPRTLTPRCEEGAGGQAGKLAEPSNRAYGLLS